MSQNMLPATHLRRRVSGSRALMLKVSTLVVVGFTLLVGACAPSRPPVRMGPYREIVQPIPTPRAAQNSAERAAYPAAPWVPAAPYARQAAPTTLQMTAPAGLEASIRQLGSSFPGIVGISVRRIDRDWEVGYNNTQLMPQQSVSKLWVAMTVLDMIDRGKATLNDQVTVRPQDLTLFHQPIAQMVGTDGYTTTISDLLVRAMTQSDNTANDSLLRRAGGPEAVRAFLARRFIANIRFGPGERAMQSAAAGLAWDQSMSRGRAFYAARDKVPMSLRQQALDSYLADPPDGAAASAISLALARLKKGEMLGASSTAWLLATMHGAKTGPQRIKGGVPAEWIYAHKTGTGQVLAGRSTGFNDVGIMTAPDGTSYAVAVMIGSTTASIHARWEMMQGVARAVAANHVR